MIKAYETSGSIMFSEEQRFPKWLALAILSPVILTAGIMLFMSNSKDVDKGEMWLALGLMIPVELILFFIFSSARFESRVTTNGLYYRWKPLQKKFRVIEREEIQEVEVRRSPALKYGPNRVPGYGKVHIARKGEGVQLRLANGKKIFFSTGDPHGLQKAIMEISGNSKTRWK